MCSVLILGSGDEFTRIWALPGEGALMNFFIEAIIQKTFWCLSKKKPLRCTNATIYPLRHAYFIHVPYFKFSFHTLVQQLTSRPQNTPLIIHHLATSLLIPNSLPTSLPSSISVMRNASLISATKCDLPPTVSNIPLRSKSL